MKLIEVFDEKMVEECLSEVEDCKEKQYAFYLLDWAMQKRKVNAVPIFDSSKNIDVLKSLFPEDSDNSKKLWEILNNNSEFLKDWLNLPFDKENK